MGICEGLPIMIAEGAKVLILGSMPGKESLEKGQYYVNKNNQLWLIIFTVLGIPEPPREYMERVKCLTNNGIALWDVLATCEREGSLDSAIKKDVPNDFTKLFSNYPTIRLVIFNGTKAKGLWRKYILLDPNNNLDFITLPSTSPTPGKNVKRVDEKIKQWMFIKEYLREHRT